MFLRFYLQKLIFLILILTTTGQTISAPIVIYDKGKTINAQQFYPFDKLSKTDIKNIPRYSKKVIKKFPVVSSMLSVGKVKHRNIKRNLPRSICVIGDDKYSIRWIKRKRIELNKINALCMVVNIATQKRFKSIKNLAPNVEFQALNGNILTKQLNIKHYPFLLHKGLISQ
jgi:integrating conjugative element protein (TIGR03765 family)